MYSEARFSRNRGLAANDGDPDGPLVDHLRALVLVERPQDAGPHPDGPGLDDPIERRT